ncbi:DgyrCDS3061 [Dimorphilus gyrociliatus]|uniref:DgyrCDS3061 n=1 Tax=Dimorphilus gyrociliatus TaxID=2664684 RepID=A0A7I8VH58_9ANNE|nr:DgyrCDS3061 [Dimorphilus gyrociliatus]
MYLFKFTFCWILLLSFQPIIFCNEDVFTNDFAVQVEGDSDDVANLVAMSHGCQIVKRIKSVNLFHFKHPKLKKRSKRSAEHILNILKSDPNVIHVEQQRLLKRVKRLDDLDSLFDDLQDDSSMFNDPIWPKQWHLYNDGQTDGPPRMDINVEPVWHANIKGDGVIVSVIDDGVDYTHPDLKDAYNSTLSFDINGNDKDPFPNDTLDSNGHGTKCAGVIASKPNDRVCGVGIAHKAQFAAIRALDGPITDLTESEALAYNLPLVDIVTASWGPPDSGKSFEGPHHFTAKVMKEGAERGRNGSGVIFIWAAGNGNFRGDFCSFDGYVNSLYTIPIGSLTHTGEKSYYSESCTANFAATFTGGFSYLSSNILNINLPNRIVTTSLHHKCTESFQGTSASAPVATGCAALIIQANPFLTWRDVQHIIALTARVSSIEDRDDWTINGAGYHVSPNYGFGALDCSSAVGFAQLWENVGEQQKCVIDHSGDNVIIENEDNRIFTFDTNNCKNVSHLEHVVVQVNMTVQNRGGIKMTLISPAGTISVIMPHRQKDTANKTNVFGFLTVMTWGENPEGNWTLKVTAKDAKVTFNNLSLVLYGTNDTERKPNINSFTPNREKLLKIMEEEDQRTKNIIPMKKTDLYETLKTADSMKLKLNPRELRGVVNQLNYDKRNQGTNWAKEFRKRSQADLDLRDLSDLLNMIDKRY